MSDEERLESLERYTPKVIARKPLTFVQEKSPMSLPKIPVNRTTVRGIVTAATGLLTLVGVLPAEAQQIIVDNAEIAFGAVTALWGVVVTVQGALK